MEGDLGSGLPVLLSDPDTGLVQRPDGSVLDGHSGAVLDRDGCGAIVGRQGVSAEVYRDALPGRDDDRLVEIRRHEDDSAINGSINHVLQCRHGLNIGR